MLLAFDASAQDVSIERTLEACLDGHVNADSIIDELAGLGWERVTPVNLPDFALDGFRAAYLSHAFVQPVADSRVSAAWDQAEPNANGLRLKPEDVGDSIRSRHFVTPDENYLNLRIESPNSERVIVFCELSAGRLFAAPLLGGTLEQVDAETGFPIFQLRTRNLDTEDMARGLYVTAFNTQRTSEIVRRDFSFIAVFRTFSSALPIR